MGMNKAKIDSLARRSVDEIADLVERQDFPAALAKIINIEKRYAGRLSLGDTGQLHLHAAEALYHTAQYEAGLSRADQAVECFKHSDAHRFFGRAKFYRGRILLDLGEESQAVDDFRESAFAFRRIDDHEGEFHACNYIARCFFLQGRYETAKEFLLRALDLSGELQDQRRRSAIRGNLGRVTTLLGDFSGAKGFLAIDSNMINSMTPVNLCNRHGSLGYLFVLTREFTKAKEHLEKSRSLASENSLSRERAVYHEYAGELAFRQGDKEEAESHYRKAIEIGMAIAPEGDLISQSYRLLAELQVDRGEYDAAEKSCDMAWRVAEKISERLELGAILRVRGDVQTRRGDASAARAAFDESIRILGEIGARYELARTHLLAGEAEIFDNQHRLTNLFAARALFDQIGVAYWPERVALQIEKMIRAGSLALEKKMATESNGSNGAAPFIACSSSMREIMARVEKVKDTDMTLLILGETGVGKDQLARFIHQTSNRADRPFETVCAVNIPDQLWESELFGHKKGTFTGADADKTGIVERADGGTVYLNEISEIPPRLQAKLLDILDRKEIRRLGEARNIKLDIRFIAASNRDLKKELEAGRFRHDLYYRLYQMPIVIPPLCRRRADITELALYFLTRYDFGAPRAECLLRSSFRDLITGAVWPGNVRQLEHFIRRLVVLVDGADTSQIVEIAKEIMAAEGLFANNDPEKLLALLNANGWNQRRTARQLGISESTFRGMMKRLKINRPCEL